MSKDVRSTTIGVCFNCPDGYGCKRQIVFSETDYTIHIKEVYARDCNCILKGTTVEYSLPRDIMEAYSDAV